MPPLNIASKTALPTASTNLRESAHQPWHSRLHTGHGGQGHSPGRTEQSVLAAGRSRVAPRMQPQPCPPQPPHSHQRGPWVTQTPQHGRQQPPVPARPRPGHLTGTRAGVSLCPQRPEVGTAGHTTQPGTRQGPDAPAWGAPRSGDADTRGHMAWAPDKTHPGESKGTGWGHMGGSSRNKGRPSTAGNKPTVPQTAGPGCESSSVAHPAPPGGPATASGESLAVSLSARCLSLRR